MDKKKGFFAKLFGGSSGGCSCGMKITEEKPQKTGCCPTQIVQKPAAEPCCDQADEKK